MPRSSLVSRLLVCAVLTLALGSLALLGGSRTASADTYVVRQGDTLSGIAACLNVNASVIQALNAEISSPDAIFAGQNIRVPDNAQNLQYGCTESNPSQPEPTPTNSSANAASTEAGGPCEHLVQTGDILGGIALTYNTDTAALVALNPGLNPDLIQVGSTLIVPCSTSAAQTESASNDQRDGSGDQTGQQAGQQGSQALTSGIHSDRSDAPVTRVAEYIVEEGDSASAIAARFGVSLQLLQDYNPLTDFNVIHPGEIIVIPVPDHLAPALDPTEALGVLTGTYTVRSGDYALKIADLYGITLEELRRLNHGNRLSTIHIGQILTVPWTGAVNAPPGTVPAVEVRQRAYQVQRGDTFMSVASAHGLTLEELRQLNPDLLSDLLVIGQLLYLPGIIEPPVVSEERTLWETDLLQYAAAALGVTPQTLLVNYPWLEPDQWLSAGATWRLPMREGLLIIVQPGDTLRSIADHHGIDLDDILADPAHGVDDPNAILIGQEIILPLSMPDFTWPVEGEITDPFGLCRSWDCSYRHKGLDVALDFYAPIVAAADGVVTFVGGDALFGLGWYIEIDHGDGWLTVYGHLVEFAVWQGQTISRGEVIGYNGSTGYSTGPHLHFEVQHNDWYVDPLVVLP